MRHLNLFLLSLLAFLAGCDTISPFVGEELKVAICDRDGDSLARNSDYCGGTDCDDTDAAVGQPTGWFQDVDGDQFGAGAEEFHCTQPDGFVAQNSDCDDTDELINPDAVETCNGYDDNCDGNIDDENINVWYADADADTFGNPEVTLTQCNQPDGYVDNELDCDDNDATVNPDGTEICDDSIDQNCNGLVDDAEDAQAWYADTDGDGYGDEDELLYSCEPSVDGYVLDNQDCDDADYDTSPAAFEACGDGVDNDCDGETDTDAEDTLWYRDADEDGYGDPDDTTTDCAPPSGYVGNAEDCDDGNTDVNPSVEEVCNNGVDDNCNESLDSCEWSGTVSLTDADSTIDGTQESGYAGSALENAGDVNGDGYEDVLMSASQVHEIYVFFGPITGALDASSADITFVGPTGSYAGMAVAGSCDLQGDGSANDLLIGAPYDSEGGTEAGAVWFLHGPLSSGSYDLDADADVKIVGGASSRFGASVACGDQDGDGDDDILVGASNDDTNANDAGAAYLGNSPVSEFSEMYRLSGETMDDAAGTVVVMADLNGDGTYDLVIGAHQEDEMDTSAGAVYVFLGPITGSSLLEAADIKLLGEEAGSFAGRTIKSADLNGDGTDDLVIGAYAINGSTGAAYVVYGPPSSGSLGSHPRLDGEAAGDNASFGLATPCDFNGDGELDLVIGARAEDSAGVDAGAVYLLQGPITASAGLGSATAKFTGVTTGDYTGAALATLDLDADGFCDLVVGAFLGDYYATNAGRAYVLYGLGY